MNLLYVKFGIVVFLLLGAFATGWNIRNRDFNNYKQQIEITAKTQQAHIESIEKQHALVTQGIKDEYDAKLNAVRNYYKSTSVWNNPSSSKVSGISTAPSVSDVISSYNQLAGQCAETTLQLVQLQKWLNEQIGIK